MSESKPRLPPTATFVARYAVLLGLCLAATVSYISRNSLAVVEKQVRTELDLSESEMGFAISSFFFSYALLMIPGGWITQRFGSRRSLPFFAMCWSAATALTSFAFGLPLLVLSRLANGTAQAGLFAGCTTSIAKWFPKTEHGFANGALASFMAAGGAMGAALTGVLAVHIGWRETMAIYAIVGILWAMLFYVWFRDAPSDLLHSNKTNPPLVSDSGATQPESVVRAHEPTPWLAMLLSPAMFWICAQQFFRAAGHMFFGSWFATYLQETREVSMKGAGILTSLPLLAVVVGGLVGGAASDWVLTRTGSRRLARQGVAVVSLLICSTLIFIAYGIEDALGAVAVISVGTFFFAVGSPCAYIITIDMGGRHVPMVFSVMNMSGNVGAMLFPMVVPAMLKWTGNWDHILLMFGGLYVVAAACWLCLNPNGTVFDQSWSRSQDAPPK